MKAFIVCVLLLCQLSHVWALSGAVVGAIYWPAWGTNTGSPLNAQSILSREGFQQQAPWYCDKPSDAQIICRQSQADMDRDIQIAQAAGITFWPFVWYGNSSVNNGPPGSTALQASWDLYQASAHNTRVNWALLIGPGYLGTSAGFSTNTTKWQANVNALVTLISQSNYQKVLTNRPIVFILYSASELTSYFEGSQANLATAVDYLKTQTDAVTGLGQAYVVFMSIGTGASAASTLTTLHGDAVSSYTVTLGVSTAASTKTYAAFDSTVQTRWTDLASGGAKTVPILQSGGNILARRNNPPPWETGNIHYRLGHSLVWDVATAADLAGVGAQFRAIATYIDANPSVVECTCFIIYSWTEHDEGYPALQPSRGDPPQSDPPYTGGASTGLTNILNTIGPLLYGYR